MSAKSVAGILIVGAVVLVPLWLKQPAAPTQAAPIKVVTANPPVGGPAAAPAPAPRVLPRFVDIGTTSCAPCKVMMGVLAELEARYPDSLKVEFINSHDNPDVAEKLNITAIPSQIFYSPGGQEIFRHTGVMRTDAVVAKWKELGLILPEPKAAP